MTLNLASQNDQFAAVLAAIAPEFEAQTGAKVNVDILSYPELLTKITADYVGHTKGYDLATVDIVWSGQFAEAGYTVDLTDWIKRDAAEIKVDDIYPSLMSSLGATRASRSRSPSPATPMCWRIARTSTKPPVSSRRTRWRPSSRTQSS